MEAIYQFISKSEGIPISKMGPHSDLNGELGIEGDDFSELMEAFAKAFRVNMDGYLWYFHHAEEGWPGLGGLFFKPPNARVQRIPVTPALLLHAAETKSWPVQYPEHELPARRYDVTINQLVFVGLAASLLAWLFA